MEIKAAQYSQTLKPLHCTKIKLVNTYQLI